MKVNLVIVLLSVLVPLLIGMLWYNHKIGFGKAWMRASGITKKKVQGSNMALIFGLTYLFSVFVALPYAVYLLIIRL